MRPNFEEKVYESYFNTELARKAKFYIKHFVNFMNEPATTQSYNEQSFIENI